MTQDLSRREEQRGWRMLYLWAIPLGLVAAVVIVVAAYWGMLGMPDAGMEQTMTPGISDTGDQTALGPATVKAEKSSEYGTILTDGFGHPLYLFAADQRGGKSTCYEDCAKAWPPLLSTGSAKAASGTNSALIGTVGRRTGSDQVTYNGWPLYLYAKDVGPKKAVGHDVDDFGGEWYLVTPTGEKVHAATGSG